MTANRLNARLAALRAENRKALALFLTSGYPALDAAPPLALALEEAGADIIELGMPFSDPLADGPVIQESSSRALANGTTIRTIFQDVRRIRASSGVPLVLMGYVNPILSYGPGKFFAECAACGVDGVILPEITLEERGRFGAAIDGNGLCNILLVAPTTPAERIRSIDAASSGFLYCVSTTGVTGEGGKAASGDFLPRVKSAAVRNPVLVGFGISTPEQAAHSAAVTDGVIIGSALLKRIGRGEDEPSLREWVGSIRAALDGAEIASLRSQ